MRHLLLAKHLWGYVDGTEGLGEGATAQVRAEFQKKSQKAFSTIVDDLSLSYVQQALVHEERKKNVDLGNPPASVGEGGTQQSALLGKQGKRRKLRCYGCGEEEHFRRDCPNRKESVNPHTAKPAAGECRPDAESDQSTGAFVVSGESHETTGWLLDSGASSQVTYKREMLQDYKKLETPENVSLGDGRTVEAIGVGNVRLRMKFKVSDPKECVMHRMIYVPKLACNLCSVRAAASKGNVVPFSATKCWIKNSKGTFAAWGRYKKNVSIEL